VNNSVKSLMFIPIAMVLGSCITHRPVRTFDGVNASGPPDSCPPPPPSNTQPCAMGGPYPDIDISSDSVCTSIADLQAAGPLGEQTRHGVACVSHERHRYAANSPTSLPHGGFDLHVLEFDDEGQPWNRAQQARTFDVLNRQLRGQPAVVVVFVHGWKHDASVCDHNLSCFREVLEILSKAETHFAGSSRKPRRVVGVYIGWRGGNISVEPAKELTFWSRKHTAHVIGDNGGVTAVIERLRTIVKESRGEGRPAPEGTSLLMVGHSFGGALLYSAVATSLNADVGAAVQQGADVPIPQAGGRQTQGALTNRRPIISEYPVRVETDGDLVILVNPAMEASRFANLADTRNRRFHPEQVPIFMTLGSEADGAVGGFFPIGQAFATVARAARSRDIWFSMDKGFGLYEPFHTHRLVVKPEDGIPLPERTSGTCRCPSNLGAFGDALVLRLGRLYEHLHTEQPPTVERLRLAAYQEMLYSRLEPLRDVDPNNPFIMASVDPDIVGGHSDIFNPRFMDFLIEYVIQTEIKRELVDDYGQKRVR
jgi:hypothetical protein